MKLCSMMCLCLTDFICHAQFSAMFQVILQIKEESGEVSSESKESQIANFVFPTLVDLGLYKWMEEHGGLVS